MGLMPTQLIDCQMPEQPLGTPNIWLNVEQPIGCAVLCCRLDGTQHPQDWENTQVTQSPLHSSYELRQSHDSGVQRILKDFHLFKTFGSDSRKKVCPSSDAACDTLPEVGLCCGCKHVLLLPQNLLFSMQNQRPVPHSQMYWVEMNVTAVQWASTALFTTKKPKTKNKHKKPTQAFTIGTQ